MGTPRLNVVRKFRRRQSSVSALDHARNSMSKPKLGSGRRFKNLSKKLKESGAEKPDALAASIGRKKYGKRRFQKLAKEGK